MEDSKIIDKVCEAISSEIITHVHSEDCHICKTVQILFDSDVFMEKFGGYAILIVEDFSNIKHLAMWAFFVGKAYAEAKLLEDTIK